MSYLAQLQEMRRQPDAIGGAIIGLGQLAGGIQQAQTDAEDRQRKLEDRLREIATGKAAALQKVGQSYVDSGNMAAAGKLLPEFSKSFNQAYGTDIPTAPILGSPVMKQGVEKMEQLGPAMPGKLMPKVDTPAPYQYDTGERTFGADQEAAIRGGLLLPKKAPDLMTASPYENVIDKNTMKVVMPAIGKPGDPNADLERMKLQAEISKLLREPVTDPLEAAERMTRIANLNDQIRERNAPKQPTPEKPRDPLDYEKQIQSLVYQQIPQTDIEKRTGIEDQELRIRRLQVGNDYRRQYPMQQPAAPTPAPLPASSSAGGTGRWSTEINAAAARHGIPAQVIQAVMAQESGGNASARSPVGAIGLMQLMPGTAAGLRVDPNDPAQNIDGGAKYLRQQFDKFGSWPKALAAYNAGPGAVEKYGGVPPYRETQGYVDRITKRLAAQGFNVGGESTPAQPTKGKGRKLSPKGQAGADALGLK